MSTSTMRRRRLELAKSLPALKCPGCGVPLERVPIVSVHVARCDRRLAEEERQLDGLLR
jgi:hypothetical protein